MMEILQSPQNKLVKRLIGYQHKKGRDADGVFIAEGLRFAEEIPKDWDVVCYGFREDALSSNLFDAVYGTVPCHIFSNRLFSMIAQTNTPQGVFAVCRQKRWALLDVLSHKQNGFFILAEELNDPGNLGTIIRTADAGGIDGVILARGSVDLYNPKVLRATMGSIFHLPIVEDVKIEEALAAFQNIGIQIIGAHLNGTRLPYDIDMKKPTAILIGNEARGLSDYASDCCNELIKIPMPGKAESLNASMAAGILIYEGVRQRSNC